jgi:hypothetical protein
MYDIYLKSPVVLLKLIKKPGFNNRHKYWGTSPTKIYKNKKGIDKN